MHIPLDDIVLGVDEHSVLVPQDDLVSSVAVDVVDLERKVTGYERAVVRIGLSNLPEDVAVKVHGRQAAASPEAVLILGSTFAVVFTEAMKGSRGKYLLCEHRPAN